MTRKLLSAAAVMVAVFFTGSLVAQAADITFGGQIRPRYEVRHQSDSVGRNNEAITMRTRLNTNIKIDQNTSAFLQFQMNSTWGGAPFVVTSGNDGNTQVGLHQAYFTIKNLFGQKLSAKVGRQQIVLDGHRLFGHTGWLQGGQSHDAARFTHQHDNMTVSYMYSKVFEDNALADPQDEADREVHILWVNMKGMLGGNSSTSGYLVLSDDDTGKPAAGSADFWTVGVRHAGGAGDIDYRGEFYYQNGQSSDRDINAFMFGLRAGYKMPNVDMKPKITLWLDYLSGTDANSTGDIESFNTLFDTGHKFYGLQDILVPVLTGNHQGLIDIAIKVAIKPMAKTTLKVDLHSFTRAADDINGNDDIGEEVDVTLIYKYSPSTKMLVGFSYFMGDTNFVAAGVDPDQSWFYVMADVKF